MPIIRKQELHRHIAELEERYTKLKKAIEGSEPNPNIYEQYHNNSDQYKNEFTEVSIHDVHYAVDDFKNVLKILRNVNSMKAQKLNK